MTAAPSALAAAIQAGLRFTPSMKNSTRMGMAATTRDSAQTPARGS